MSPSVLWPPCVAGAHPPKSSPWPAGRPGVGPDHCRRSWEPPHRRWPCAACPRGRPRPPPPGPARPPPPRPPSPTAHPPSPPRPCPGERWSCGSRRRKTPSVWSSPPPGVWPAPPGTPGSWCWPRARGRRRSWPAGCAVPGTAWRCYPTNGPRPAPVAASWSGPGPPPSRPFPAWPPPLCSTPTTRSTARSGPRPGPPGAWWWSGPDATVCPACSSARARPSTSSRPAAC